MSYNLGNNVINNYATTSNLNNGSFDDIQLPSIKRMCLRTDQYGFVEGITNAVGVLHNDNADTIEFSAITAADINLGLTGSRATVTSSDGNTLEASTVTTTVLEGLDARVTTNTTNIATNTTNIATNTTSINTINNITIPDILDGTTEYTKLNFYQSDTAENIYFEPHLNGGLGTIGLDITNSVTDGSYNVSLDIHANADQNSYLNFYQDGSLISYLLENGTGLSTISENKITCSTKSGASYIDNIAMNGSYTRITNPEATGNKLLYYNSSTKLLTEGTSRTGPSFTSITDSGLSANYAVYAGTGGLLTSSSTDSTRLGYINTLSSNAQTQISANATNISTINDTTIPNILDGTTAFSAVKIQAPDAGHASVEFYDDSPAKKGHLRVSDDGKEMELGCTTSSSLKINSSAPTLLIYNAHTTASSAVTSLKNTAGGQGLDISNTGSAFTGSISTTGSATIGSLTADYAVYAGTNGLLTSSTTTSTLLNGFDSRISTNATNISTINTTTIPNILNGTTSFTKIKDSALTATYVVYATTDGELQPSTTTSTLLNGFDGRITTITGTTIPNILNGTTTFTGIKTNLTTNKIAYINGSSIISSGPDLMYYSCGFNSGATTTIAANWSSSNKISTIRLIDMFAATQSNTAAIGPYMKESYDASFYTPNPSGSANKFAVYTLKTSGQKYRFIARLSFKGSAVETAHFFALQGASNATGTAWTTVVSGGVTCLAYSVVSVQTADTYYTITIQGYVTAASASDTLSFWNGNTNSMTMLLVSYSLEIEHCL